MADEQDFDFQMSPASQEALRAQTEAFPDELRKAMRKQLAAVGDAAVSAMRAKLLQAPPGGGARSPRRGRPHDSRRQTAAGLGYTLTDRQNGVDLDLTADTNRLPRQHRGFPWVYDRPAWAHPVFGRVSARQQGRPWRDTTIKQKQQEIEDAMAKSLDDAAATVKGSNT